MSDGLEDFLDGLVPRIALCGEKGLTISGFLSLVQKFHRAGDEQNAENSAGQLDSRGENESARDALHLTGPELAAARWLWNFVRVHPDIHLKGGKKPKNKTFDELLALPEAEDPVSSKTADARGLLKETGETDTPLVTPAATSGKRPQICVSEDLMWKHIAGHSKDFRRVPKLEWICLLGIAETAEEGIFQSDLVQLTGQDKRSVPKRTDALAAKGYIVKRSTNRRKQKTSKLWLSSFEPRQLTEGALGELDFSPKHLTKDVDQVAWASRWLGTSIDIELFARTFLAIVKAWGTMRYSDLKSKLGIAYKPWQMKTLSRYCRRFVDMGLLSYSAGVFSNGGKIYKDCVKFIREPTPEEWALVLATGKKNSIFDKAEDRYERQLKAHAFVIKDGKTDGGKAKGRKHGTLETQVRPGWVPEKPFMQTAFEAIRTGGDTGASVLQISVATVGYNFRRFVGTQLERIVEVGQPAHLRKFQLKRTWKREGRQQMWYYSASSAEPHTTEADPANPYGFGNPEPALLHADADAREVTLDEVSRVVDKSPQPTTRKYKMRGPPPVQPECAEASKGPALTPESPKASDAVAVSGTGPGDVCNPESAEKSPVPERPSGVFRGKPHSLDPQGKRGRPKNSCVVLIRSTKLKNANFFTSAELCFVPSTQLDQEDTHREPCTCLTPSTRSVDAQYEGEWGRLIFRRPICSCTREDSSKPVNKALHIDVKDLDKDVSVEDTPAPGDATKGLVCMMKINQDHPSSKHVFTLREDEENEKKAEKICEEVSRMRAAISASASVGGTGAGHIRGRPYRCEKCGGSWKNATGLTYHLNKSKGTCNPNWKPEVELPVPKPLRVPAPKPVRVPSPLRTAPDHEDRGQEGEGRRRPSKRIKLAHNKLKRDWGGENLGSFGGPKLARANFRGLDFGNIRDPPSIPEDLMAQIPGDDGFPVPANGTSLAGQAVLSDEPAGQSAVGGEDVTAKARDSSSARGKHRSNRQRKRKNQRKGDGVEASAGVLVNEKTEAHSAGHDVGNVRQVPAFQPTLDYRSCETESQEKMHQIADIVRYLLENMGGVFPGDRALFYAVLKVYLQAFQGFESPTTRQVQKALDWMDRMQEAKKHTYMVKGPGTGRLHPLTLVVGAGVDPTGPVARRMKEQIKAVYPRVFIPEPFSLPDDELQRLEDLDSKNSGERSAAARAAAATRAATLDASKNGEKFRMRRNQETIEVLAAPFYLKEENRPQPRKRHNIEYDVDGMSKRRKLYKYDTRKIQDIDWGMTNAEDASNALSVFDAVKQGLLLSERKRRRSSSQPPEVIALPAEIGRTLNPGLSSLPPNWGNGTWSAFSSNRYGPLRFLAPIMQADGSPEATESMDEAEATDNTHMALDAEPTYVGGCPFTPTEFIEGSPDGTWPVMTDEDFEKYRSFTLKGPTPDVVELFTSHIPHSAEEMASRAGHTRNPNRQEQDAFWCMANAIQKWEHCKQGQQLLTGFGLWPKVRFINMPAPASHKDVTPPKLYWFDDIQLTLETLPYAELSSAYWNDMDDDQPRSTRGRRRGPGPTVQPLEDESLLNVVSRPPGRKKNCAKDDVRLKMPAITVKREHTAYPKPGEYFREKNDQSNGLDWSGQMVKLVAFVVVTTLLGGLSRTVDWGIMMRLFPDSTLSQLRRFWRFARLEQKSVIAIMTKRFRPAFLQAYERDELPALNFDNTADYDWKRLVKWAIDLEKGHGKGDAAPLPADVGLFKMQFDVTENHADRHWRESFFDPVRSVVLKYQDLCSESLSLSADHSPWTSGDVDAFCVAISWTRVLCMTHAETYAANVVEAKLNTLCGLEHDKVANLLNKANKYLHSESILTKVKFRENSNGRPWRLAKNLIDLLDKRNYLDRFARAVLYKAELDAAFREHGRSKVPVVDKRPESEGGDGVKMEGITLALLDMQAHGRVRIETTGRKHVPLGFKPGDYETRKFGKTYQYFSMHAVPTSTYQYGEHDELAALRHRVREAAPPTEGPLGAIPLWCDVMGEVDSARWLKFLGMVLHSLAARGATPAPALARSFRPALLLPFEAQMILDWGESLGVLRAQFPGGPLAAAEWWWVVPDAQRERFDALKATESEAKAKAARMALPTDGEEVT